MKQDRHTCPSCRDLARAALRGLLAGTRLCLLLAGVAGCGQQRERSLIDDLRFVAAAVEPPEVEPGDTITVSWEIADPGQASPRTLEYLFVACSQMPGMSGCLEQNDLTMNPDFVNEDGTLNEAGYREYFERFIQRGQTPAGTLVLSLATAFSSGLFITDPDLPPPEGSDAPPTSEELDGRVSLLVCASDACARILGEIDSYVSGGDIGSTGAELLASLASGSYLEDLSFTDTARAVKSYILSHRGEAARNHNPAIDHVEVSEAELSMQDPSGPPGGAGAMPGTALTLELFLSEDAWESYEVAAEDGTPTTVEETLTVHWFTTAGAISPQRQQITDLSQPAEATLILPPDASPDSTTFYVSVTDERFGCGWTLRFSGPDE